MSIGNCDDITHLLNNNSHNDIARSFPESLINFEDRPSWPTALLPSSCLMYLKTVSSDMHLKSHSVVGGILALINRIPSCELCFSMASRKGSPERSQFIQLSPVHPFHDDVIKWKHFPRNWPFVRGIHRSPVNSPYKGQ